MSVEFKDNSAQVKAALSAATKRGLEAIGLAAEGHAKDITPVNTGRLRNSIAHATDDTAAYIGTNVEYAPYVELGAQGRAGAHMLQRSATEHSDEYKRLMKESLENA